MFDSIIITTLMCINILFSLGVVIVSITHPRSTAIQIGVHKPYIYIYIYMLILKRS